MIIIQIVLYLLAHINVCKTGSDYDNENLDADIVRPNLVPLDDLPNAAHFSDAQHRGPKWFGEDSKSESTELGSTEQESGSGLESSSAKEDASDESSSASSFETSEKKMAHRTFRECTACPHDMMKAHKNAGIKWLCGGYQRARRSFKSECMMRYRNCEDGTMFVKLYDHRCKNDTYHGQHWFYVYKT